MTIIQICPCGAAAVGGIPTEQGMKWFCNAHAPYQCIGCGPDDADEDAYPDACEEQEPPRR